MNIEVDELLENMTIRGPAKNYIGELDIIEELLYVNYRGRIVPPMKNYHWRVTHH
jgi:hypothetical protein